VKSSVYENLSNYDGAPAFGGGLTALLHDTRNYAVVASGGIGIGFNTGILGGRGGLAFQW
jgi:hypothetical protein